MYVAAILLEAETSSIVIIIPSRCLRITDPNDPVLQRAARESGNPVSDIIENLPADLAIWIDPGEVRWLNLLLFNSTLVIVQV